MPQFGDSVSIAVLKLYGIEGLTKPEITRPYLTLVEFRFSDRKRILEKTDEQPRITSLVLDQLEQQSSDPIQKKHIEYIRECIKVFSCSFQGEADFSSSH